MCPRPLDDGGALRLLVFRTFITLTNLSQSVNYFAKLFFLFVPKLVTVGCEDTIAIVDRPGGEQSRTGGVLGGDAQTNDGGHLAELHGDRSISPKTPNYPQQHL